METSPIDESKIRDKNVLRATKAFMEARQKQMAATEKFRSVIRQFVTNIRVTVFTAIPVLELKISRAEANRDETIKNVEESMENMRNINEQTRVFCEAIGATFDQGGM